MTDNEKKPDNDAVRKAKITAMQKLVDEAYASGISERSMDEIFEDARSRHERGEK